MRYLVILAGILLAGCADVNVGKVLFGISNDSSYLEDKNDRLVRDCRGNLMNKEIDAPPFWRDNNLPKGTTDFVCKDGKAYLPNKATDCQGKPLSSYPNGIMGFKQRYNFPRNHTGNIVGYTRFTCENGVPTPFDKKD